MKILAIAATALAGLAFWRRKTLKDDVVRATDAGKDAATKVGSRVSRTPDEPAESSDDESNDEVVTDDAAGVSAGENSSN